MANVSRPVSLISETQHAVQHLPKEPTTKKKKKPVPKPKKKPQKPAPKKILPWM